MLNVPIVGFGQTIEKACIRKQTGLPIADGADDERVTIDLILAATKLGPAFRGGQDRIGIRRGAVGQFVT